MMEQMLYIYVTCVIGLCLGMLTYEFGFFLINQFVEYLTNKFNRGKED